MLKKVIIAIALLCICSAAEAADNDAEGCIVIESMSGQVIYSYNENKRLPMASTTKIMTALVALENGNPEDVVTVSQNAQNQEGSSIYLRAGEQVPLRDLLYGIMLNSGNDAAMAIAEHIGQSEENFVQMMNNKAEEIGMKNTKFKNPSGLSDENHYSTASDMAYLMAYAMKNSDFREIASRKEHQINANGSITYLKNHNKLLWRIPECIGGKTGFTKAAGRCLVSSGKKNNIEIVAVTLNDKNDWEDHERLYKYAFERTRLKKIISKFDILCTRKINGQKVNVLAGDDFEVPKINHCGLHITCKVRLRADLPKHIEVGSNLGVAEIFSDERYIGKIELMCGNTTQNKRDFFENLKRLWKRDLPESTEDE